MKNDEENNFYTVAYEAGASNSLVPVWASSIDNPVDLERDAKTLIRKVAIPEVPGAFQLLDLLSQEECDRLIEQTEALGYTEDAAISLPRSVRHNDNLVWVTDAVTHNILWERSLPFMEFEPVLFEGKKPSGLNQRFRFYKYGVGDFFKTHTDGSWPGSAVINGRLVRDAFGDRYSLMTFLLFLSDGFEGGETRFMVNEKAIDIRSPRGGVLCFPHGTHPMHCLHSSVEVRSGVKYIIRTDVLFK